MFIDVELMKAITVSTVIKKAEEETALELPVRP